jgi:Protein of unknown function (DUF1559)
MRHRIRFLQTGSTMAQRRVGGKPRRGLTVTEVVVVVVLLIVVVGVLLTAIPRLRESAHREQCANNLKQLGEAVRRFRDAEGFLPAARIADRYATWAVQIAPYLNLAETNGLRAWDLRKSYYLQPDEVRAAQVLRFYCPSRRRPPQLSVSGDVPDNGQPAAQDFPGALGDYGCCSGDGSPAHPWTTAEANGAIILGEVLERADDLVLKWRNRTDYPSLRRGESHTILLGEKHVPWGHFGEAQRGDGSLYNGDHPASEARVGGPGHGLAPAPDAPFKDNFGSYHPGICQFLMADGSVKALANSIQEDVLGRLATRGD